jgi:hypothetical protein
MASGYLRRLLPLLCLLPLCVQAQNTDTKTAVIPQLDGRPTIDGRLDDAIWAQALVISDLHQVFPQEFVTPFEPTEVRLFYSANALYIGARMYESDTSQIAAQVLRQGQALNSDDLFAVIIDPYLDRRNGYRFEVNANGVRWDGLFQNIDDVEGNWEGIWEARSATDSQGWTTELRIPLQTLSFNPDSAIWGINFNRLRRRSGESIAWMSRNREINPSTSGMISGLSGLRQGVGLDIVPSMAVRQNRTFATPGTTDMDYEPQLDVYYKLTPQLNAALTINTDFSATEVDDRQVNLTRFNLFFPEKRDFFLRDVDIFEFGQIGRGGFNQTAGNGSPSASGPARQNARPFFSRKIGLDAAGQPVDIVAGGKISGRVGNWNVGTLLINQDEAVSTGVDATNIFVGRAVYNLGTRTQLGAIVTDGDPQSNNDNTLVGADFRYRNPALRGNSVETYAFYQQSDTQGRASTDNASWGLGVSLPNSQGPQGALHFKRTEKNFFPAVGFVNRTDVDEQHGYMGYRHFLPPGGYFRSVLGAIEGYRSETLADGRVSSQNLGTRISINNNTGDTFINRWIYNTEVLLRPFTLYRASDRSRTITIAPGEYNFLETFVGLQLGQQRMFSGNIFFTYGDYFTGDHYEQRGQVNFRPNRNLSMSLSYGEDYIKLPEGNFTVRQYSLNTQYAFSAMWSWSNLIQYDNVSENLGLNSRLVWIPRAGQQAFLVLNWGLQDPDKDNTFESTTADLSLKFNYTFRF